MSSQKSFQSRTGFFTNGLTLINSWDDYNPPNVLIARDELNNFIEQVQQANTAVNNATVDFLTLTAKRRKNMYSKKGADQNCLEKRIRSIINFIRSYESSTSPTSDLIRSALRKARPYYRTVKESKKKGGGEKKIKPGIQSSYDAFVGIAHDVHTLIEHQGAAYNPNNPALQPANFFAFVQELEQLNRAISSAEADKMDAISKRRALYDGEKGMNKRISLIKNYLSCFEGGKKSDHFISFTRALRGV